MNIFCARITDYEKIIVYSFYVPSAILFILSCHCCHCCQGLLVWGGKIPLTWEAGRPGGGSGHLERGVLVSPGSHSSNVRVWEEMQHSSQCVCVLKRFVCL